jgi:hypothetical protein
MYNVIKYATKRAYTNYNNKISKTWVKN